MVENGEDGKSGTFPLDNVGRGMLRTIGLSSFLVEHKVQRRLARTTQSVAQALSATTLDHQCRQLRPRPLARTLAQKGYERRTLSQRPHAHTVGVSRGARED